jgi:hypothetical protein
LYQRCESHFTLNQALANQRGPRQLHSPLVAQWSTDSSRMEDILQLYMLKIARRQYRGGEISVVRSAAKQRLTKAQQTGNLGVCFSRCKRLVRIFILTKPADCGSSLADFFTLKMQAIRSSETSAQTRSTRRHIPEDGILHIHRRENLKSYIISSLVIFNITKCKCSNKSINQSISQSRQTRGILEYLIMRASKQRTVYTGYRMFNK